MRESDKYHTSEIQDELLGMMKDVHKFFEEKQIRYSLCGGSLLGAVRHEGFIPWDDDIDIMVDRENYNKIVASFHECPGYVIKNDIWLYRIYRAGEAENYGAVIDIFVMDKTPKSKATQKIIMLCVRMLQGMLKEKIHYSKYSLKYRMCLFFTHVLGLPFSYVRKFKWYNAVSQLGKDDEAESISMYDDTFDAIGICYEPNTMDRLALHKFEDTEFYITELYDSYLTKRYGQYMIPVEERDRVPLHIGKERIG